MGSSHLGQFRQARMCGSRRRKKKAKVDAAWGTQCKAHADSGSGAIFANRFPETASGIAWLMTLGKLVFKKANPLTLHWHEGSFWTVVSIIMLILISAAYKR